MDIQKRLVVLVAVASAALIGIGGVAWACVPGHDHTNSEEPMPAALPPAPIAAEPAPAPVSPAPAPAVQAATVTTVAPTAAPAPAAEPAAAPAAPAPAAPRTTRTTAAPVAAAPAPAAVQPAAPVTTVAPAAVPAAAPAAAPVQTPVTTGAGLYTETVVAETSEAGEDEGSGAGRLIATVLVGGGVFLLLGAVGGALLSWRRSVGPPVALD